jgi:molybdopterin synthase catalytic subunit
MIDARVQQAPLDTGDVLARLEALGGGAVASFTGLVRGDGGLTGLRLDHYPGMTETALQALVDEAARRWRLVGAVVIHRVGAMVPGDRIVFVGTAAAHRAEALDACAYLIDRLKTDAPFWKQESFADGRVGWVEAREADDHAAARWEKS